MNQHQRLRALERHRLPDAAVAAFLRRLPVIIAEFEAAIAAAAQEAATDDRLPRPSRPPSHG